VKKKFIVGICLLLADVSVRSQHTLMRSFNINDGLVSNQVRGFYQDQKGFIWIMTWEGLSRHDGYAFRNYTMAEGLAHPLINAMIEGKDGRMYIAENDGTVDVILNGKVHNELRKSNANTINKFISEPSGRILAPSDDKGVCVFDEGSVFCQNNAAASFTVFDVISNEEVYFVW
jgi:ligand-binding sensor domain-containing protein